MRLGSAQLETCGGAAIASESTEEPIMNTNRLRLWTFAVSLCVALAANGTSFFYIAQGAVPEHPFADSNGHGPVPDTAGEENASGWTGKLNFLDRGDQSGRIVVDLADRAGKPLTDLAVKARVVQGAPGSDVLVVMHESSPGRYVGQAMLDRSGQWEIQASARRAAEHLELSQQIVVN
jgi:nitrogen fixation protein FixH